MIFSNLPIICRMQDDRHGDCGTLATAMVTIVAFDKNEKVVKTTTDYYCNVHAREAVARVQNLIDGHSDSGRFTVEQIPLTHPGRENESPPSVERR